MGHAHILRFLSEFIQNSFGVVSTSYRCNTASDLKQYLNNHKQLQIDFDVFTH